jgi:hypothetical protein
VGHPWPGTNHVDVKHKVRLPLSVLKMLFLQTMQLEEKKQPNPTGTVVRTSGLVTHLGRKKNPGFSSNHIFSDDPIYISLNFC